MENNRIPVISICGRPNVGKSSLFNALLGERRAVVVNKSGTTRDRVEVVCQINDISVKLVDTGGYLSNDMDEISVQVKEQIVYSLEEAAVIVLVTDTLAGISPFDEEIAKVLRRSAKPVILVANKTDNEKLCIDALEFYSLGFGAPVEVSSLHRSGINALKDRIGEALHEHPVKGTDVRQPDTDAVDFLKIAIVGRPNVGKSSFVNSILNRKRVIVSDIPGTTRDSVDTHFDYKGNDFILIDTAGIRHDRKIKDAASVYGIIRSKEAVKRADCVMLLLDAASGITRDDTRILDLIEENGKGCLVLVNKWDLSGNVQDVTKEEYKKQLLYAHNKLTRFPVDFVSAKTGEGVLESLESILKINNTLDLKISTRVLNKIFEQRDPSKVPVSRSRKRPNFFYVVQIRTRPLEFKYFVSDTQAVTQSHVSFIENRLREKLPLSGVPLRIVFEKSRKDKK